MSLPADWTQVPVTGTFVFRNGDPLAGKRITFESDQVVTIGGEVIVPKRLDCTLDDTGSVPAGFTLPSTNDPDLNVTGWAYTVKEKWPGGREYAIFVEADDPDDPTPIDLADVSPAVDPDELTDIETAAMATAVYTAATAAKDAAEASATTATEQAAIATTKAGEASTSADAAAAVAANLRRDTTVTITVGTGGDYATLNEAIEAASEYRLKYKKGGVAVTIQLLTGFVLAEQVLVEGIDLGWIEITSVDASVTVTGSAMVSTTGLADAALPYVFAGIDGATLPRIAALFAFDATGAPASCVGLGLDKNSKAYVAAGCGVTGVTGIGLLVHRNSTCWADAADFRNAVDFGALVEGGSRLSAHSIILSGCGGGMRVSQASIAEVSSCDVSGAVGGNGNGILVTEAATVNAQLANADNCAVVGFRGRGAGTINITAATARNCGAAAIYAERLFRVNADRSETAAQFEGSRAGNDGAVIDVRTGATVAARSAVLSGGYVSVDGQGSVVELEAGSLSYSGVANVAAVVVSDGGCVGLKGATVTASGGTAMNALFVDGGTVQVDSAVIESTLGAAVQVRRGGRMLGHAPTIRGGSGKVTVIVNEAGEVDCSTASIKVNGTQAMTVDNGSRVSVPNMAIIEKVGTPTNEVIVRTGSIVQAPGTTFTCSLTANTLGASGLLIR